jgi:hypothetical protein
MNNGGALNPARAFVAVILVVLALVLLVFFFACDEVFSDMATG